MVTRTKNEAQPEYLMIGSLGSKISSNKTAPFILCKSVGQIDEIKDILIGDWSVSNCNKVAESNKLIIC